MTKTEARIISVLTGTEYGEAIDALVASARFTVETVDLLRRHMNVPHALLNAETMAKRALKLRDEALPR